MEPVFVIFRSGISGGTATLSMRVGEWLKGHGYRVLYICQVYNDMNNVDYMRNRGFEVYRWALTDVGSNLLRYCGSGGLVFLTYSLEEHLFVEGLRNRVNVWSNILYVVHHYGLKIGSRRNVVMQGLLKLFLRRIIRNLLDSKSVIFMDYKSIEETERYYGLIVKRDDATVHFLPMQVAVFDPSKVAMKLGLKTFNLLTIARADFPFKGYIIGLIDDFRVLCSTNSDITLTIISFGEDLARISAMIKQLPASVRGKISLVGRTPYDELYTYFDKAHLFLGMGTTILDAVNHGVPSIVVEGYTYSNNASGFFHMQPHLLAAYDNLTPAINHIKGVIQMGEDEYIGLCKAEHDQLQKHYGIESFGSYLTTTGLEVGSMGVPSSDLHAYALMQQLNKMLHSLRVV